ncbi:MAG: Membrane bound containing D-sorbitol dehydrogenase [Acidobacteriota bacterium]|jgi:hypothetical protein|nr:Membrane bound containing D-sorbitol dehydrogenase [Acidobacteriota bacterium]
MNLDDFVSLSEFLVGVPFSAPLPTMTALDPKLAQVYMTELSAWSLQGPFMEQLLTTWNGIKDQPVEQRTASVNRLIMNDENLGPLARQIILAWYTGFHPWSPGQQPTPDPANYSGALVWMLARAHPMAVPLSFGYWQTAPAGTES